MGYDIVTMGPLLCEIMRKELDVYKRQDVYGPDAVKLMGQVCTNDFTTLGMNGIRHAVMCNEKGQILTDGVVIRIGEDRYRTYWLDPVISYYVNTSDLDVHGENMSGRCV